MVDSGGDAPMAAKSATVSPESAGGNSADVVPSLQWQVLALQSDHRNSALAKLEAWEKKVGGKGGMGVGGSMTCVEASMGAVGHRQSECPALDARNGQRDAEKGGKSKGGSKGLKGTAKGGEGKGLCGVGWIRHLGGFVRA